jgi:hypothetical protein
MIARFLIIDNQVFQDIFLKSYRWLLFDSGIDFPSELDFFSWRRAFPTKGLYLLTNYLSMGPFVFTNERCSCAFLNKVFRLKSIEYVIWNTLSG